MTLTPQSPRIVHGDCLEIMKMLPDCSVDSIVTDPPYGLGFMGKAWDALPPGEEWARECLRVLKPGGHLLAFGGTRTWHRLAVAVEDAGFEIRDSIAWMYGSGFPKSLDVSKAIDKAAPRAGMFDKFAAHFKERRLGSGMTQTEVARHFPSKTGGVTGCAWNWENAATVPTLAQWQVLAPMLQLSDEWADLIARVEAERKVVGTSTNGIAGGTGRHAGEDGAYGFSAQFDITAPATEAAQKWQGWGTALKPAFEPVVAARKPLKGTVAATVIEFGTGAINIDATRHGERWPANVILDETQAEALAESKYFYVAKPSKAERPVVDGVAHPTVKPLALMRHLVKLVTPSGGTVLEPFAGSGATVEACILEGFHCIAIEREAEYLPLIQARINRQDAA